MVHRSGKDPACQAAHLLIASLLLLLLAGCEASPTEETVVGRYMGKLPSGQYELRILQDNGLFFQQFFDNEAQFIAEKPTYSYTSTWSIKEGELWIKELTDFYEMVPPFALLKEPLTAFQASPVFWRASGYGSEVPIMIEDDDTGVIFEKRHPDEAIRTFGWER